MLKEKTALIKNLANLGASIDELNNVRIAISELKGGKLAQLGKNANKIISLVISDVVNDPLEIIASGPTYFSGTQKSTAQDILEKYKLSQNIPESISKVIKNYECPKSKTLNTLIYLIGNNQVAINAAIIESIKYNLSPIHLSSAVQGNVEEVSEAYFKLAYQIKKYQAMSLSDDDFKTSIKEVLLKLSAKPDFFENLLQTIKNLESKQDLCIIAGGETTVNVTGKGLGGRNQELALRFTKFCIESQNHDLWLLSAGTDGIDGPTSAAGAIGNATLFPNQKLSKNIDDAAFLKTITEFIADNDSFNFYQQQSPNHAHIICGHTNTNVMDVHLLIIQNSQNSLDLLAP